MAMGTPLAHEFEASPINLMAPPTGLNLSAQDDPLPALSYRGSERIRPAVEESKPATKDNLEHYSAER